MFLSDTTIKELVDKNIIKVIPKINKKDIRPTGIRLHLGREILMYKDGQTIDPQISKSVKYDTFNLQKEPFILKPGQFVIGYTHEKINTPRNIIGFLDGRSTIARLGLTTHITAAIIDGVYGEYQAIALEIKNVGNLSIKLSHKMAIGLLLFAAVDREIAQDTQKQYKNQVGLTPPNLDGQFK